MERQPRLRLAAPDPVPAAAGVLPFGFRRQPGGAARLLLRGEGVQFLDERLRVGPGDVLDGEVCRWKRTAPTRHVTRPQRHTPRQSPPTTHIVLAEWMQLAS